MKHASRSLRMLLLVAVAGACVAVTYFYFEYVVSHSISYVWEDVFNTDTYRLLLVPLCLVLTLIYFGAQHLLDPKAEKQEAHGLGDAPPPTVANFVKVLGVGFLSLLAGASLGPEAILVPACVLLGSFIGVNLLDKGKPTAKLFGMAGFIALMTAFFNSFFVGLLSLLLIKKQFKTAITPRLIIVAAVTSGSAALTLRALDNSAFVQLPHYSWTLDIKDLLMLVVLALAGYGSTYILAGLHKAGQIIIGRAAKKEWWVHALIAGSGLSLLYLLGGSLVQFTGNDSVIPMFRQASDLGFLGLVWLFIIKIGAIGWSKASGYRGGLIFPTIFVASLLVAMGRFVVDDLNLIYGLIVVLAGALAADSKVKVLL